MRLPVNTRVLYTFLSASVIILGSLIAIRYAQGDRLSRNGVQGTGLLSANSFPPGAEVYINGKLQAATDDTLYVQPGFYEVEIRKDSYTPWKKRVRVERELVTQTNAQLFRQVPSFTPLTFTGVNNISPSPDGQRLLYYTASASASKNGLYILDLGNNLLPTQRDPRQIAEETPGFDLKTAQFIWSPDNSEVMMTSGERTVLLDVGKKNILNSLPDVTARKLQLLREWESELYLRERGFMARFPDEMIAIATQSATNVYLSPDKKKLLYTATASAMLPENITPALPASSSQPEERQLQPGATYIYDREEDKNFRLDVSAVASSSARRTVLATDLFSRDAIKLTSSPSAFQRLQATTSAQTAKNFASYYSSLYSTGVQWFPDSKHVFFHDDEKIYILEYDNTNRTPVYAGPFDKHFTYPWPDGSRILILTTFGANTPPNLYAIELK